VTFFAGGAVPLSSAAYVVRDFEQLALQTVNKPGAWILLLGPRQHGKSSSLIRLRRQLSDDGIACFLVDLQALPPCASYEELLAAIVSQILRSAEMAPLEGRPAYPRDLLSWLEHALVGINGRLVLVIDEASAIANDEWRNALYGQIRSMTTLRAQSPGSLADRVQFVFSGMFRPEEMVDERNSPFNTCERILQHLFMMLPRSVDQEAFEHLLADVRLGEGIEDHLSPIFKVVETDPRLLRIVKVLVRDGFVPNEPASRDLIFLQVLGLVKRSADDIVFRNALYAGVAQKKFSSGEGHERGFKVVVFTDLVGSTEAIRQWGDKKWHEYIEQHALLCAALVAGFGGSIVKSTGDGILAIFSDPGPALRCADELRQRVPPLGLGVRVGVHAGECQLVGSDVAGIAVNVAHRLMESAPENQVRVSSSTSELVDGSPIRFDQAEWS